MSNKGALHCCRLLADTGHETFILVGLGGVFTKHIPAKAPFGSSQQPQDAGVRLHGRLQHFVQQHKLVQRRHRYGPAPPSRVHALLHMQANFKFKMQIRTFKFEK